MLKMIPIIKDHPNDISISRIKIDSSWQYDDEAKGMLIGELKGIFNK